ncbi:hypothetical protein Dsin_010439 [Dipteronia sinensis]|uniref:Uncharacterized protein n=1 Tax=Dipteronia sinensis TaxID=43782 RepID=A0AAE0ATQ5_9ROSI|nr:hypothetical protein Dsin_010439 [Dipteronia sinensis]
MLVQKIVAYLGKCLKMNKKCPKCGSSRWKVNLHSKKIQKGVPAKVLRYFPIIPRLRRIFGIVELAEQLRWHETHKVGITKRDIQLIQLHGKQ